MRCCCTSVLCWPKRGLHIGLHASSAPRPRGRLHCDLRSAPLCRGRFAQLQPPPAHLLHLVADDTDPSVTTTGDRRGGHRHGRQVTCQPQPEAHRRTSGSFGFCVRRGCEERIHTLTRLLRRTLRLMPTPSPTRRPRFGRTRHRRCAPPLASPLSARGPAPGQSLAALTSAAHFIGQTRAHGFVASRTTRQSEVLRHGPHATSRTTR